MGLNVYSTRQNIKIFNISPPHFNLVGELLGMEYLYSQTGKTLTPVLQNPEEEDRLVEHVNDQDLQDEGFEEEILEDITVPRLCLCLSPQSRTHHLVEKDSILPLQCCHSHPTLEAVSPTRLR